MARVLSYPSIKAATISGKRKRWGSSSCSRSYTDSPVLVVNKDKKRKLSDSITSINVTSDWDDVEMEDVSIRGKPRNQEIEKESTGIQLEELATKQIEMMNHALQTPEALKDGLKFSYGQPHEKVEKRQTQFSSSLLSLPSSVSSGRTRTETLLPIKIINDAFPGSLVQFKVAMTFPGFIEVHVVRCLVIGRILKNEIPALSLIPVNLDGIDLAKGEFEEGFIDLTFDEMTELSLILEDESQDKMEITQLYA